MKRIIWTTLLCAILYLLFGSIAFGATVLFEETFESQDAFFRNWEKAHGIVRVENNTVNMGVGTTKEGATAEERACFLYLMPVFAVDFDLEIDFKVVEVNPTLDTSFVAITFRKVMPLDKYWNSGYTVRFTKGAGEVSFWRVKDKLVSVADKADFSGAPISTKVEARGGKINVYVNGELLIEFEEEPDIAFLQGFFGVFTEATHIEISKFKVIAI